MRYTQIAAVTSHAALTGSLRLSAMPASANAPRTVIPVHISQDTARLGNSGIGSARSDMAFLLTFERDECWPLVRSRMGRAHPRPRRSCQKKHKEPHPATSRG